MKIPGYKIFEIGKVPAVSNLKIESNFHNKNEKDTMKKVSIVSNRFLVLFKIILFFCFGSAVILVFLYKIGINETVNFKTNEEYVNNRPIIGILAQELYSNRNSVTPETSYIAASYVKFIEGAGGRVIPIKINQTEDYYWKIFQGLNGILFPGGGASFNASSGYASAGKLLMKYALKANDNGDYFPIWGTCLGFEFLLYESLGGKDVQVNCNANNITDKLEFTKEAYKSKLFGNAPSSILKILSTQPVTSNFHHKCITEKALKKYKIEDTISFLSWNNDPSSGIRYLSSMEFKQYPFFGVQFHPEKNMYEWSWMKNIPHSAEAIRIGQYFAQFLVNEARKSRHVFSEHEEIEYLIYKYNVSYTGGVTGEGSFVQVYVFSL